MRYQSASIALIQGSSQGSPDSSTRKFWQLHAGQQHVMQMQFKKELRDPLNIYRCFQYRSQPINMHFSQPTTSVFQIYQALMRPDKNFCCGVAEDKKYNCQAIGKKFAAVAVERVHTSCQQHIVRLPKLMFYLKVHEEKQRWMLASTEIRFNTVF